MQHSLGNRRALLALALVAAGALWLLVQIGFVPRILLDVMATWWPVLLVGAGLDIVAPRLRPVKVPFTALACLIIIGLALVGVSLSSASDTTHVVERDPGVYFADIDIELGSAPTTIGRVQDDSLLTAHFVGQPQGAVVSRLGSLAAIEVRTATATGLPFLGRGHWTIGLPTDVPIHLAVSSRSADSTVDLTRISLEELQLEVGSGQLSANLPGLGSVYSADVSGGSGDMQMRIAPGASVDMNARFRSGTTELFVGEGTDMRLELRAGSGSVTLDLPDTAPIRLSVEDDGSGRLFVPSFLERRSGSGDRGVWESGNLEQGGRVIEVTIREAGSGAVTIR
ncbi:MAG TPA: hypothetical protein VFN03_08105 [Trueperaceae bacterium]|nr:hypothetical protein [Trueperaceae bacterium]